jgi:Ser/Thr protein kinase RdoA (MazF antagonist)
MMQTMNALGLHAHVRALGLGELVQARLLARTPAYLVLLLGTPQGSYLARVGAPPTRAQAAFEQRVRLTLLGHGLRVPKPLGQHATAHLGLWGAAPTAMAGQRAGIFLYTGVGGRQLAEFALTAGHTAQVGHYLGRLHRLLRHVPKPHPKGADEAPLAPRLAWALAQSPQDGRREDLRWLQAWLASQGSGVRRGLPVGLAHGQLLPALTAFGNGRLLGALDYGSVRPTLLVHDVAAALYAWGFGQDAPDAGRLQALVEGYGRTRALSAKERAALWPALCLRAAQQALQRFIRFELEALSQRWEKGGQGAPFAPRGVLYEDYRHDLRRLQALERLGPSAL